MNQYNLTKIRAGQWLIIILVLAAITLGYFYYRSKASVTINESASVNLTNGLVGHWTFDGTEVPWTSSTAATATDRGSGGNDGTLTNMSQATSPVQGKIGQALDFDGSNDYVTMGDAGIADFGTSDFSVSGWIKTTATTRTIMHKRGVCGNSSFWNVILDTSPAALTLEVNQDGAGTNYGGVSTATVNDGTWHHFTFTRSGSTLKAYFDGGLSNTASTGGTTNLSNAANLNIGGNHVCAPGSHNPLLGSLDDIRIYSRELSTAEISFLAASGAAKISSSPNASLTSGLFGHWTFDGADVPWTSSTAATATDRGSGGNDGTLTNMSQASSVTDGRVGQALDFDGINDYVDLGTGMDMNGEMTIALWFRPDRVTGTIMEIVANNDDLGNQDYTFELNRTEAKFSTVWGNATIVTSNTSLTTDRWYHLAMVRSGSSGNWTARLYINGTEDNSGTTAVNPNATNVSTTIGRGGAFDGAYTEGKIDDVRIYTRALAAGEIASLYQLGEPDKVNATNTASQIGSLGGHWTFDGADVPWTSSTAATATDRGSGGNDGTLTNMSQASSIVEGKIGQALTFDGVNDEVTMGDASIADFGTSDFTISGWMKSSAQEAANHLFIGKKPACDAQNSWYAGFTGNGLNNVLAWSYGDGTIDDLVLGATPLKDNVWHHFVVTRVGAVSKIYIDGVLDGTGTAAGTANLSNSSPLLLGTSPCVDGVNDKRYVGALDEIRIYNDDLTAEQVYSLYNQGR